MTNIRDQRQQGADKAARAEDRKPKGSGELAVFEGKTVFHEDWWLNAATNGTYEMLSVEDGGKLLGFWPVHFTKHLGRKICQMPPLTHVLGPVIDIGQQDEAGQRQKRFDITRRLIDKLPKVDLFRQVLGDEIPDALGFQAEGFRGNTHYTLLVDCSNLDVVLAGFRQTVRRHLRKTQTEFEVMEFHDPVQFQDFYVRNIMDRKGVAKKSIESFQAIFSACKSHNSGKILAVTSPNGDLLAAIFVVWGCGRMYYLMTSRDARSSTHGLVELLIWRAMNEAHRLGVTFDLDGIASEQIFRFLNGFGGHLRARTIVQKQSAIYDALQLVRRLGARRELPAFY